MTIWALIENRKRKTYFDDQHYCSVAYFARFFLFRL